MNILSPEGKRVAPSLLLINPAYRICYQLHNVLNAEEVRALFHALTVEKGFNTGLNTYPPRFYYRPTLHVG